MLFFQINIGHMVLTHMTLKYNKLSDIAAGPFFQVSGFQVSRILPMILQQEPNLSIIVASFMDQINEIRKKVGFIEINILNYITFLFFEMASMQFPCNGLSLVVLI